MKRINPVSPKRKAENAERKAMLLKKYGEDWRVGHCERCGRFTPFRQPHELKKRSSLGSIVDPENVRLLCGPDFENNAEGCHAWTESHVKEATAEGWIIPSWAPIQPPLQERKAAEETQKQAGPLTVLPEPI